MLPEPRNFCVSEILPMDSMSASASPDQSGSHGSSATHTAEQVLGLALQFMLPKTECRISRRQDQYHCASTKLFACAASRLQ